MGRKRAVNVSKVVRHGKEVYRARLSFKFNEELGFRPSPRDFYGKTERDAIKKRDAYDPKDDKLDRRSDFLEYIRGVTIPRIEKRAEQGAISYAYSEISVSLLRRFLLEPVDSPAVKECRIRRTKLGLLSPAMMLEYFDALKTDDVYAEGIHRIKQLLCSTLKGVRDRLGFPVAELFEDIELPTIVTKHKRLLFSEDKIFAVIHDETLLGRVFKVRFEGLGNGVVRIRMECLAICSPTNSGPYFNRCCRQRNHRWDGHRSAIAAFSAAYCG
jgi:hypothetical protein